MEKPEIKNTQEQTSESKGFGESLGISESDIEDVSVHERGNAQVVLKRFENGVKSVAKKVSERVWDKGAAKGLDSLGNFFNKNADRFGERWEKLKNISSEWMGDVVETIKLNTVDKWRFLNESDENNKIINRKMRSIADLESRVETEVRNISIFEANKVADNEKFAPAVASAKDAVIKEIFERTWREKVMASEQAIKNARSVLEKAEDLKMKYTSEIVQFQQNVERAGSAFFKKINTHIEKIRTKCGFYELQEEIDDINSSIESHNIHIVHLDKKIIEYSQALTTAQEMGVSAEDCQILRNGIANFESKKSAAFSNIRELREIIYPLYTKIQNIKDKTRRYEDMKKKMGIELESSEGEDEYKDQDQDQVQDSQELGEEVLENGNLVDEAGDSIVEQDVSSSSVNTESSLDPAIALPIVEAKSASEESLDTELENIEAQQESVNEVVSKTLTQLYKLINEKSDSKLYAIEILDKTIALGKILAEYEDVFTKDEDEHLSRGFKEIQQTYDRRNLGMMTPEARESIKKDVLNKIIRQLPDWISL